MTALLIRLYYCNSSHEVLDKSPDTASAFKIINVTTNDGHPFGTGNSNSSVTGKYVDNPGGGVMTQAFYLDVPSWRQLAEHYRHKSNSLGKRRNRFDLVTACIKSSKQSLRNGIISNRLSRFWRFQPKWLSRNSIWFKNGIG